MSNQNTREAMVTIQPAGELGQRNLVLSVF